MAASRRAVWPWFIVAVALIAAGLRNMFLPGFLSISPGGHGSGVAEVVAGLVIATLALIGRSRRTRAGSRQV
jgi:hypothetical protein